MQAIRVFLFILSATASVAATNSNDALEHVQTLNGIEEYVLRSNGLTVLLMPNKGLPVATVMVTYEVGSRHEVPGTTGATHILEHMMFKGTPRFNAEEGNDYSTLMERIGARSNATTWFDRTNYYATLPSEYVSLAIEIEADRMRNLLIREQDLNSEMTVVRNEYERGENSPVRTLIKELFAAAFTAHTYSHPTIGWKSDIESTSPEKLRKFYDKFYWPENAVLTVIGGFDRKKTIDAIVQHYGAIEKASHPIPEVETVEPEQIGPRRVTIKRAGQVGVVMAGYKVPEATHEDWPALLLIDEIVGADKTGRLYRALEDKGKASATFTFAPELHDPGLFVFGAYLTPDATHEEVETIIKDEINTLIGGGVTEEELQRAKSVIRANIVYGRDGPFSIASQINEAIAMGDWTSYVNRPKQIEAVTSEDIRTAAERYFTDKASTTGWFIPEAKNILAMNKPRMPGPNFYRDPDIFEPYQNKPESAEEESLTALVNFSSTVRKEKVAGIEVVTIDMPIESVVSFAGSFAAGEALSPSEHPMLASLTAAMLDKGTTEKDRFAIAELLDTLGSDIAFSSESHSLSFSGRFLRPDAGAVLALLAEQLRTPAFESEVFETVRSRQEANLLMAVDDPTYRGSSEISRMLYPVGHPNREEELGILIEDLKRTNVEDLRKFHREHYGPESMRLVFAGDIDFEQIKAAVANAFEGWTGGVAYPEGQLEQFENRSEEEGIFIEDKTSVSVHYAYNTGLQRIDEDYLPFMIGNYILGGSFGARLMTEVRKNRGLTYDIRSFHQGDIMTPGNWVLRASFSPNMLDSGLEATEEVLDKWYTDGVSDEEVERAIETLTGSYLVGLSTTHRVAQQMHSFLQRELGTDYIDKYPLILRKISAPSVNRAIKKHLNPAQIRLVIAGSLENENAATSAPKDRSVSVRIDTPHPGWKIRIEKIFRAKDSLIVVSRLSESGGIAAQVITAVADKVEMPLDAEIPVRHYVLGKTWNWGGTGDYTFIDSMDKIGTALNNAELIYSR